MSTKSFDKIFTVKDKKTVEMIADNLMKQPAVVAFDTKKIDEKLEQGSYLLKHKLSHYRKF